MTSPKMIMGEPPDVQTIPLSKYLLWGFILIIACGVAFYLINNQKKQTGLSDTAVPRSKPHATPAQRTDTTAHMPKNAYLLGDHPAATSIPQTQPAAPHLGPSFPKPAAEAHAPPKKEKAPSQLPLDKDGSDTKNQTRTTPIHGPSTLYFGFKDSSLSPESTQSIKRLFRILKNSNGRLFIEGHTCSLGSEESNTSLSEKRARRVKQAFRELGLGMNIRISIFAFGERQPININETEGGRKQNRRVVIRFIPDNKANLPD